MRPRSGAPSLCSSDGVTLRAFRADDVPGLVEQALDPATRRWSTAPLPGTPREARHLLAASRRGWRDRSAFTFAVEVSGRFAGGVALRRQGTALRLEFGIAPWARGRGIAVRAVGTALGWAFETHDPEVVLWRAVAGDWAARRVAWAVGIRVEGTVRGLEEQRGVRLDGWIGSLRRGEELLPPHPWFDPPVIDGAGVRLRPHAIGDVPAMAQACNDPLTQRWLAQLPRPFTPDHARAHLEEIYEEQAAGRGLFWAVADPGSDRLIGEIGMWGLAQGESTSGELGYWTHPAERGRGVMSRAVGLAARWGLATRGQGGAGLLRLVIRAADGNLASRHVAERAGFAPAGRDRRAQVLRDGSTTDLMRYDLLRSDLPPDGDPAGPGAVRQTTGRTAPGPAVPLSPADNA